MATEQWPPSPPPTLRTVVLSECRNSPWYEEGTVRWLERLAVQAPPSFRLWPGGRHSLVKLINDIQARLLMIPPLFTLGSLRPGGATNLVLSDVESHESNS